MGEPAWRVAPSPGLMQVLSIEKQFDDSSAFVLPLVERRKKTVFGGVAQVVAFIKS